MTCIQKEGQSCDEFFKELQFLAKACDYGDVKDELIRDKIVCSLRDKNMQKRLLEDQYLTLKSAMEKCLISDMATQNVMEIRESRDDGQNDMYGRRDMHRIQFNKKDAKEKYCNFCGKEHVWGRRQCEAWGKYCSTCGECNHHSRVCHLHEKEKVETQKMNQLKMYTVKTDSNGNDKKLCKFHIYGKCKYGDKCRYSHKKKICQYHLQGTCKFGRKCFNSHENKEQENVMRVQCFNEKNEVGGVLQIQCGNKMHEAEPVNAHGIYEESWYSENEEKEDTEDEQNWYSENEEKEAAESEQNDCVESESFELTDHLMDY